MIYSVGIDEVGRGAIAGPLVVCAVKIKNNSIYDIIKNIYINDSKLISEKQRKNAYLHVKKYIEYKICFISANDIDKIGISNAISISIKKCTSFFKDNIFVFIDGNYNFKYTKPHKTIIKGDQKILEISIASIIAKLYRDAFMKKISIKYPQYNFNKNVGYCTYEHIQAIKKYGLTDIHRKTFCKNI